MGIENRVCLVAGGTGDIGKTICSRLLDDGYTVVLAGQTADQVDDACADLEAPNAHLHGVVIDVRDEASCSSAVAEVMEKFGRLDCLVNCAGISYIAPLLLGKLEKWRDVLEVNTLGAFVVTRAVLRPMIKARFGRIIHIGSISAEVGAPYNAIYAASKAGVAGLVRSFALEVAAVGITVNAVQPGYVKTKLFAQTQGARARIKGVTIEEHEQDLIRDTPTRKLVTPKDVASAVACLVSDDSASITGQTINVDGGRTAS